MVSIRERENMIQFLVKYFGVNYSQLTEMSDRSLEYTYEFAYSRTEMESDY